MHLRRSPHLAPGSAFLAGLLLALLGLSAVLAYQAADAARSEAVSTDRALRGYASFATWELARRADDLLRRRLSASLQGALRDEPPTAAAPASAAAEALAAGLARELAWCDCARPLRGVFVLTLGGDRREVRVTGASPAVERWLARGGAKSTLPRLRGDTTLVEAVTVAGEHFGLVARLGGTPAAGTVVGFLVSPAEVAPAVLEQAYGASALLPATLRGAVPASDAVAAAVLSADGAVVWRSRAAATTRDGWVDAKVGGFPQEPRARGTVTERLDGLLAGLSSRVAVRADAVGAAPGTPRSRLPLLLTVFGLTLALVCVAIVQLRRQQELVRLRDDFVSGVSHELRTPLAQIRLFADLLESGRLATGEQRSRSIRIINEESRRLSWLVENILHFSRSQRGAGRIAPQPVEAAPLVREIVDGFAPLARERDARFAVSADDGVVVRVDADALRQVLLNLLDNAVKYGPTGQTVRVRVELRGLSLRVSVDDRGPGIPLEERARVWEPYRRLPRDAEGATGGSGIGLAVVKDLVELHGGRVGVAEAPGGGARFWFELPYAMHAGPPADALDTAQPARAAAR
jgi:signal transduction histidine kinase